MIALTACNGKCTESGPDSFHGILSQHIDPNGAGVAAIVVNDGKILFRAANGIADIEKRTPLDPAMQFRIASLTKPFTAAAILLLVDRGKLSVTDDIVKYLPDYPTHGESVTIEHLLTHTSGIKDYTEMDDFEENMDKEISLDSLISLFKSEPLEFKPGSQVAYSNSGYILLGAIIERVSGRTYSVFMEQKIFEPLGMFRTRYDRPGKTNIAKPLGYNRDQKAELISSSQTFAAGALISNVDDLARWDAAVTSGKLLKQETWERMFTPYTLSNGEKTKISYGGGLGEVEGHFAVWHKGRTNGFSSMMIRLPDENIFVAVLSNNDRFHIFSAIQSWFYDADPACMAVQLAVLALRSPRNR